jgi:uncharacterized membrane protein YcaP (DUF421 family)
VDLGRIAVRVIVAYVYLLVMTRLSGKRAVSQSTPIDCLVALIIGDLIDDALWADVPMAKFGAAVASITFCELLSTFAAWRWRGALHLLEGRPSVLVRDGVIQRDALRSEQMSDSELLYLLRLQGIEDLEDVHLALAERGHSLSVIRVPDAQPVPRGEAKSLRS